MNIKQNIVSLRQEKIIDYLKIHTSAKTEDFVDLFNISPITIRRDFKDLEESGLVIRYYGGVKLIDSTETLSLNSIQIKKNSLAKYAASLIDDDDIIFINSSSTAISILEYLENKRVVVVTNNATALSKNYDHKIDLILTGGSLHPKKESLTGDLAIQVLSNITATKCFIGVSGIDSNLGISTSILQETSVNKEMINRTNGPIYVLATSDKLGIHHNFSSGSISSINCLITDKDALSKDIDSLNKAGVDTILIDSL